MSYFSDTADSRWNQACIVDLGAGKFPIWRVVGGLTPENMLFIVQFDRKSSISDFSLFLGFLDPIKS